MDNTEFWKSIRQIIDDGFTPQGLDLLGYYAEKFISTQLVFDRFSPNEQFGCSKGGSAHVIASILAGTKDPSNSGIENVGSFEDLRQQGAYQTKIIGAWAKSSGIWFDNIDGSLIGLFGKELTEGGEAKIYDAGNFIVKTIGLDYYVAPVHALDRISLHNCHFPETTLEVIGFGKDSMNDFQILVSQQFVQGNKLSDNEIKTFAERIGFKLINARNWTYATDKVYLSDLHDENLIKSDTGTIFVVDCDIRINTPELKCGGIRRFTTDVTCYF